MQLEYINTALLLTDKVNRFESHCTKMHKFRVPEHIPARRSLMYKLYNFRLYKFFGNYYCIYCFFLV